MESKTFGLIAAAGVAGIVGYLVWKSQQKAGPEGPATGNPGTGSDTPAPGGDFGIGGPGINDRIWNNWFCSQYPWLCATPARNPYGLGVNK